MERTLTGRLVLAFESRRAAEFERLLGRHGARFVSAPALREVAIDDSPEAHLLFDELEAKRVDAVLLLTGVGTRALVDAAATRRPRERIVDLLGQVPLVARGPKPIAALRELGLTARIRAPEPNTWREILAELDRELPVRGMHVAVQEYGRPNAKLLDGLEERGATTLRVPVYRWALPEDLTPLRAAIERILAREADLVVFTTAVQLDHLLRIAGAEAPEVCRALAASVVASIGPTATEALRERGIDPQIVPEHPKLGYLAAAIAERAPALLARRT